MIIIKFFSVFTYLYYVCIHWIIKHCFLTIDTKKYLSHQLLLVKDHVSYWNLVLTIYWCKWRSLVLTIYWCKWRSLVLTIYWCKWRSLVLTIYYIPIRQINQVRKDKISLVDIAFCNSLLAATLYQGMHDRNHKLLDIVSYERYILHMQMLLECCYVYKWNVHNGKFKRVVIW
jgi:hypothetical protein